MSEQGGLEFPAWYRADELFDELLDRYREFVDRIDRKQALWELSHSEEMAMQPQTFDNALKDRARSSIKMRHVLWAILRDDSGGLIEWLADKAGYELVKKRELTPEERLERLQRTVRANLGPLGEKLIEESER